MALSVKLCITIIRPVLIQTNEIKTFSKNDLWRFQSYGRKVLRRICDTKTHINKRHKSVLNLCKENLYEIPLY